MKKIVSFSIVLLLLVSLVIPAVAADRQMLVDNASLLSEEQAASVEARLEALSDELNFDVVILTTTDLEGKSKAEFADDFYDYNDYGIGREGDRSGALLLVYDTGSGTTERWISTRGYGITAFTDYGIQYVGQQLVPLMDNGEWEQAFLKYADLSKELVGMAREGKALDVDSAPKTAKDIVKGVFISLIVGLVIAFVVRGMVKSKYKPVQLQANASDYLVPGSLNITGSYENFRTTSVTRTQIKSSSSGGSSTHTSSSGASHGGGGF